MIPKYSLVYVVSTLHNAAHQKPQIQTELFPNLHREAISALPICSNSTTECVSWCSLSVFSPLFSPSCYRSNTLSPPFEAANFLTLGLTQDCILSVLSYTVHRAVCCPLRVGRLWKTRHIINRRVNNFPQALLYQSLDMAAIDAWAVCVCVCVCDEFPDLPVSPAAGQYKANASLYLPHHLSLFPTSFTLAVTLHKYNCQAVVFFTVTWVNMLQTEAKNSRWRSFTLAAILKSRKCLWMKRQRNCPNKTRCHPQQETQSKMVTKGSYGSTTKKIYISFQTGSGHIL